MTSSTTRLQQLAAMYARHDAQLQRVVRNAADPTDETTADACAHAWAQLLAADHVDLTVPWRPLAWLTTTAVREAKRLNELERRATPRSERQLDALTAHRDLGAPSPQDTAVLLERLDLVNEIPERPRRFLLRLALGYSYDEISAAEGVSYTTTNKQIARAKRILRELEQAEGGE